MKKIMKMLLLAAIFTLALSVSAFAAGSGPDAGICDVADDYIEGVTVTPMLANGTTEATENAQGVYANAKRVTVTFSKAVATKYYLVVALDAGEYPTVGNDGQNNVAYINQVTADGTSVSFDVYPKSLVSGQTYSVYVSSNDGVNGYKKVASFSYYEPYTLGNVDMSTEEQPITTIDAMMTLQMAVGLNLDRWTDTQWLAANVNKSSVSAGIKGVDTIDAMLVLQRAVNLIQTFPTV